MLKKKGVFIASGTQIRRLYAITQCFFRRNTMRLLFRLLLIELLVTAAVSNGLRIATVPCNGVIPIDSQTNLDPVWSLAYFRSRVMRLSNNSISLSHLAVDRNEERFLVSETGLQIDSITVFAIAPVASSNSAQLGSLAEATACTATLNPLLGAMDGMTSRAARFTVLRASDASGAVCSFPLNVSLVSGDQKSAISMLVESEASGFSSSVGFSVSDKSTWPLRVSFSSQCALQFVLVLDRYGAIDRWYVWIPATVYTAIITVAFFPIMVWRRQLPVHLVAVFLFLVFFGFLGSCIGLVVELLQWQSALSRMFPFPPSVTLYCCLCVLYILLFLPVLFREGSNAVLFMGAMRFFTYGLNCALCVGYWIAGYVVLGSLAVFQLLATSCILTWYYAYVSVYLRRAVRGTSSLPKFSNNFLYLWCVPVTPFACCGLMYYDLYTLVQRDVKADASVQRARDVIRVYNTQISLPLVFFQNVYGVALLATATAFHMPFVVLLFVALLLGILHIVYVCEQYGKEWSRWRHSGGFLDRCGRLSLSPVMAKLLSNLGSESATGATATAPSFVTHVVPEAAFPSPQSVRRRGIPSQYEADIAAYRESQALSSTASDDDSSEDPSRRRSRRHVRDHSAAYSTPSHQNISDAPEYWPSSVER